MLREAFGTPNIASSQFDEYSQLGSRRKVRVKSKETVGNFWPVLKVILGHKYHNHYSRKPQQNFFVFHIFLSLIVSSRRHELQMANEADAKCG